MKCPRIRVRMQSVLVLVASEYSGCIITAVFIILFCFVKLSLFSVDLLVSFNLTDCTLNVGP